VAEFKGLRRLGEGIFCLVNWQCFVPDRTYRIKSKGWFSRAEVTFYPFLIVLETEGKQFCWMPYWHVTGKEARYGQHAVCLEQRQFESLMAQVQEKLLEPV
jgi:hypothetical protein